MIWTAASPGTTPMLLPPLSVLSLLPAGVKTTATALSLQNIVVGVSVGAAGTKTPVSWTSAGVVTPLAPPLLLVNTNCVPADINDASPPSVVGNCPSTSTPGTGTMQGVLWSSVTAAYTTLPVPSGATNCITTQITLVGQILGECFYSADTYKAVVWGPDGTGPQALTTLGNAAVPRSTATGINDTGVIACNYLAAGSTLGFKEPCSWDSTGGNTNALQLTLPAGANHGSASGVGNNGKIIGNFETTTGLIHPFHDEPGVTTAVDDGSLAGCPSTAVTAISKGGTVEAAVAENGTEGAVVEKQSVP